MRIKSFSLLVCALLSVAAIGQKPEAIVKKASVAPVIDGVIDAVWAEANTYSISKSYQGEVPTLGAEGETTWKGLWTDEGIYFLLQVADDAFFPNWADSPENPNIWQYDNPELFFDINAMNLEDGLGVYDGQGHHMISPGFIEGEIDGSPLYDIRYPEVLFAHNVTDPNYLSEYFIPYRVLTDSEGRVIPYPQMGFDVYVRDRDLGDSEPNRAVWANTGAIDEAWINMDDCGIITLEGSEGCLLVDSIYLEGGIIESDQGTLQMNALVFPEFAFNKNLEWSVENISGKASINADGLLTAISNGTVIVIALATDGTAVEDTALVTITNQLVQLEELNLIRNGNFDRKDALDYPEEWFHIGFKDSEIIEVHDGHMVLDPPETEGEGYFWDSQFIQENFNCNTTSEYLFSFVAWAKETRPFRVDFEDPANVWIRYGSSDHEYSPMGESEWIFDLGTEPISYSFYVEFDKKLDNTIESLKFQLGESGVETYLDSVRLINLDDLPLISNFKPVTSIIISSEGDAVSLLNGQTLQMSAELLPLDATLADFRWSVVPGTGNAIIDKNGLLTATKGGTITVFAIARDGSNYSTDMQIEVIQLVEAIKVSGEGGASSLRRLSTLQMNAEVLPADATLINVIWSLAQGTGEASIDENGLLTGLETGNVIVMAFATDESSVSGTKVVEIVSGVGIESSGLDKMKVYPNPAANILVVGHTALNSMLSIFSSTGILMERVMVDGTVHHFNISSYPAGTYFVKNGSQVAKFVK